MAIRELKISNLRNIERAHLNPGANINLIFGANGSGKTTLLESIHLLGLGRSFRSAKHRPLLTFGQNRLTVYGELVDGGEIVRIGVSKDRQGDTQLKENGAPLKSSAELAVRLPIVSLTSDTFSLVLGPPSPRRRLLDWLAFHVEPQFLDTWRKVQGALKQRNNLLRRGKIDRFELRPWDQQLSVFADKIDDMRLKAVDLLRKSLEELGNIVRGQGAVEITYARGWNKEQSFAEALESHLEQDVAKGYTQAGPHRADLRITVGGVPAAETLSRGQQKLLVSALVLAQGNSYFAIKQKPCTYLVDDIPSELDSESQKLVGRWLSSTNAQVFVTGIDEKPLLEMWPEEVDSKSASRFHVEHGVVQMLPAVN